MGPGRWLLFALPIVACACDGHSQVDAEVGATGLPDYYSAECADGDTVPSVCIWAASVAELFRGVVLDVRALTDPPFVHASSLELVDRCEGGMDVGLRIRLRVEDVIRGTLSVGEVIDLHVGAHQAATWRPFPVVDEGELRWIGGSKALQEGQVVVVPGHWNADRTIISAMGERLFGVSEGEEGEVVRTQAMSGTICPAVPAELTENTYPSFVELVGACPETEAADERSDRIVTEWTAHAHYFSSSVCYEPLRLPGPCLLDSDCAYNQYCVGFQCASE